MSGIRKIIQGELTQSIANKSIQKAKRETTDELAKRFSPEAIMAKNGSVKKPCK